MSFWSKPSTTTSLLVAIASLLLILVVQNASRSPLPVLSGGMATSNPQMPFQHPPITGGGMPPQDMGGEQPGPGEGGPGGAPSGDGATDAQGNFDPGSMIFGALTCPDNPSATLADKSCSSADADARRNLVREGFKKEKPIREVFDELVKKYGEGALTAQARDIRQQRLRAQQQQKP